LQRLFTTFADGWPGFGLLFQRLVTGIVLLHHGTALFKETPTAATIAPQVMGAVLAIFIIIGLWTPAAGAVIAAVEVWTALVNPGSAATAVLLATLGATLAMIGPGAFSIDARLFGRKHISS
jgi:putative oxidoreductase